MGGRRRRGARGRRRGRRRAVVAEHAGARAAAGGRPRAGLHRADDVDRLGGRPQHPRFRRRRRVRHRAADRLPRRGVRGRPVADVGARGVGRGDAGLLRVLPGVAGVGAAGPVRGRGGRADAAAGRDRLRGARRPAGGPRLPAPRRRFGHVGGRRNLLPQIGTLTPELQYLALDADQQLVVGSDTEAYAGTAIAAATGEEEGVDDLDAVLEAVGDRSRPRSTAATSCAARSRWATRARRAGAGQRPAGRRGRGQPPHRLRDGTRARRRRTRGDVVRGRRAGADQRRHPRHVGFGAGTGKGGDFTDRFRLGRVAAEGEVVTMALDPVEGSYVLSDLSSGPVLFATC